MSTSVTLAVKEQYLEYLPALSRYAIAEPAHAPQFSGRHLGLAQAFLPIGHVVTDLAQDVRDALARFLLNKATPSVSVMP